MANQAAPAGSGRALGHSEHRIQRALQTPWSSPSLTRDAGPGRRPEHSRQGRCRALTAHAERGSPTWRRPLNEGPVIGTALDDRVHHAGHLGGDRGQRLAPQVGIVPITGDGALERVAEAVLFLADRHLAGEPQGPAQASVAVFRQLGLTPEGAGLMGGQIKPAELQELTMVAKAAQVAGLGQNGERGDWSNPWNPTQELVVRALVQELDGHCLKGVALLNEAARLSDHKAEQTNCRGIGRDRQTDRGSGRFVDISKQALLGHLAPNHAPGGCDERLLAQGRDAAGGRKAVEEGKEPITAAVVAKAGDLGKVEGQVVGQDAVEHLGLGFRDRLMGPRDLTVTHIFLLWSKDLISLADLAASGGRARDRTCSMKRVVGPRPSSGRLTLGMPDAPTVS